MEIQIKRSCDLLAQRRVIRTRKSFLNMVVAGAAFFIFSIAYANAWSGYQLELHKHDLCWKFSGRPAIECHV